MKIILFNLIVILMVACGACENQKSSPELGPLPLSPSTIGTKENPNARLDYETKLLADPITNEIPVDIHRKELMYAKSIRSKQVQNLRLKTQDWLLSGPSNIGGRTRALAVDIQNEEIILAGGVSGGIWRSTNGGLNWSRTSPPNAINSVSCIVQDTRLGKRNIWYFGTGELVGNSARAVGAPYRGDGIYKSVDGGESWDVLTSTSNNQPSSFDSPFNYVSNLAVNPKGDFDSDEIYAATYGNIIRSVDGGISWETVLGEPNLLEDNSGDLNGSNASVFTNIMITPKGKMFAYLSTSTGNGNNTDINKGIFSSIDGKTWENITPADFTHSSNRLVMAYAPSDENTVYFLVEGSTLQLWKFQNNVWADRSGQIPDENAELEAFDSQNSYNMTIHVHPKDANTVYIGGTNLYRSSDGFFSAASVSQIGGYDLEESSQLYANHHPDQHALVFLNNSDQMLNANDGGVFKTFDNMAQEVSWVSLNNGYVTSQFYAIALSKMTGSARMIGGTQDNGTLIKTQAGDNVAWNPTLGGDGSYCATTPEDLYWYASFQQAGIFKIKYNPDGSISSWAKVDPEGMIRDNYLFIAPFVLDPNNFNRMYLAGDSAIWRNDNLTQIRPGKQTTTSTNWATINPISNLQDITALDISTNPAHILYYGTAQGEVYKIVDANEQAPEVTQVFSHQGYVSNICMNPSDANELLICYSNYNIASLFYSQDGGRSFTDVGGNLEEYPDGTGNGPSIRWSEIIPLEDGSNLYLLATSMGLYSTHQLIPTATSWTLEGEQSIGYSLITMIDYRSSDGKVAIATHGNGIFVSEIANTRLIQSYAQQTENIIIASGYPNPFDDQFKIKFSIPQSDHVSVQIIDLTGRAIKTLVNSTQFEGDITVYWDGKNQNGHPVQNGMYHYQIKYGNRSYGGKVLLHRSL